MNKAIFLDRDGVINESHTERVKYVNSPHDFYLLPGVADASATLRESGYKIFVVTNQAGVSYGLIQQATLDEIHAKMMIELRKENPGAIVDDIMTCTHHPKKDRCICRKPKPGMLIALAALHNIDLSQSWMVGDMQTDIEAGTDAGCGTYLIDAEHSLLDFAEMIKSAGQ